MRQGGLRQQGCGLGGVGQRRHVVRPLHPPDRLGRNRHGPDRFLVALVAHVEDAEALRSAHLHLVVDLRDERADRVDHVAAGSAGSLHHLRCRTVGRQHHRTARGQLRDVVDEDHAEVLEAAHHALVVDDLVVAVDGRVEGAHHPRQCLDRHLHAGAEAARLGQQHPFHVRHPAGAAPPGRIPVGRAGARAVGRLGSLRSPHRRSRLPSRRLGDGVGPGYGARSMASVTARPAARSVDGVWSRGRRQLTTGLVLTVTLFASEALAVAAIMPKVAEDLGRGGYGAAFSAFFLGSVVGVLFGGPLADRFGAALPFAGAAVTFAAGLVVSGFAPTMAVLVGGRLLQGIGAGPRPRSSTPPSGGPIRRRLGCACSRSSRPPGSFPVSSAPASPAWWRSTPGGAGCSWGSCPSCSWRSARRCRRCAGCGRPPPPARAPCGPEAWPAWPQRRHASGRASPPRSCSGAC